MTNERVRKNIRMSKELAEWYEDKALQMGVTQSNLMVMALSNYMSQEKAVNMSELFKKMVSEKLITE